MEQMQEFYRQRVSISFAPKIGAFVVCQKSDGKFYRAQIQNTRDNRFKYQCVDVGDKTTGLLTNIWPLDQRFAKLDRMAIQCTLRDVMLNYSAAHIDKIIARFLPPDTPNTITAVSKLANEIVAVNLIVGNENLRDLLARDGVLTIIPEGLVMQFCKFI